MFRCIDDTRHPERKYQFVRSQLLNSAQNLKLTLKPSSSLSNSNSSTPSSHSP